MVNELGDSRLYMSSNLILPFVCYRALVYGSVVDGSRMSNRAWMAGLPLKCGLDKAIVRAPHKLPHYHQISLLEGE